MLVMLMPIGHLLSYLIVCYFVVVEGSELDRLECCQTLLMHRLTYAPVRQKASPEDRRDSELWLRDKPSLLVSNETLAREVFLHCISDCRYFRTSCEAWITFSREG
jgi:hypothetical protein